MKRKVLFLITKSNWGGAQRYVYDLATSLPSEHYEPVVVLGGNGALLQKLQEAEIKTIQLQTLQRDISITKEIRAAAELWRILRDERPDILHVNSSKAGGVGCLVGRLAVVSRIIFTAHGWAFNEDRPNWQKTIIKFLHWVTVLLSHHTIAVSHTTKRQLHWPGVRKKMTVVHNGRRAIDFVNRAAARTELVLPPDTLVSGTIAELHPVKQHDVLIRAIAKLRDDGHTLTHIIIGAGSEDVTLQQLARDLHVDEQIIFAGAIHEAARYLPALDIYVQPSRSEALAYTVIEAAQAGLPIIASNVGGMPEIVTDNHNGLLVPSGDSTALAEALRTLIQHTDLRQQLSVAARERGQDFTFDQMLTHTLAVYDSNTTPSANAASRAAD